ncbi:hypothetical protein LJR225_004803 [Phenylobacterium sp. LjRoot225]|uniref:hypothetical protein n=1 Tax=Phenylobacterium sp. LjRoot225 TaxID=3342285 RepID=UPI003ECD2CCD
MKHARIHRRTFQTPYGKEIVKFEVVLVHADSGLEQSSGEGGTLFEDYEAALADVQTRGLQLLD